MKLGILTDLYNHYKYYEISCKELIIDYVIIDFVSSDWLINIRQNLDCDGYLVRPTHDFQEHNDVYMERLYFLNKYFKKPIYPNYEELKLYENKRNMATWLFINGFNHAKTWVFLNKKEAKYFFQNTSYPKVIKSNIGSAATGVRIVKNKRNANKIVNNVFGRIHPLFTFGQTFKRKRLGITLPVWGNTMRHALLVQDFYSIKWEWRIIKIGNTFSGHQKLLKGKFASGSGEVGWVTPPIELLQLVNDICNKGGFYSMAVDIFETTQGEFIVNELQSLFGSFLPYQMKIDGIPGRYILKNGKFIFEKGEFHIHSSYYLRVQHFIEILNLELQK
jgi:glutathione synthase/RimK-type ligase-like ATP-grasp enzyme